jgi:nicotinamidase-related amidase
MQRDFCELPVPATLLEHARCACRDDAAGRRACAEATSAKPQGSLAVRNTGARDSLFHRVNDLQRLPGFALRVASLDWHPCTHVSFANTHGVAPLTLRRLATPDQTLSGRAVPPRMYDQMMWPVHCVQNTAGAELVDRVDPARNPTLPQFDLVVKKAMRADLDGYSAFGDGLTPLGDAKEYEDTGLWRALQAHGIGHVVVCGIATDYCVRATVIDALNYDIRVTLAEDACRGVSPETTAAALADMAAEGAKAAKRNGLDKNMFGVTTVASLNM